MCPRPGQAGRFQQPSSERQRDCLGREVRAMARQLRTGKRREPRDERGGRGGQRCRARDVGLCAGCSGGLGSPIGRRRWTPSCLCGLVSVPGFVSSCSCWRPLTPDLSPGITRLGLSGDLHSGRHRFWTRLAGLTPRAATDPLRGLGPFTRPLRLSVLLHRWNEVQLVTRVGPTGPAWPRGRAPGRARP